METTERIAKLNDMFRSTLTFGGKAVLTAGVANLGPEAIKAITKQVREFADFDAGEDGNDPYNEHDFGAFDYAGNRFFWKIDYYDNNYEYGSENPADPTITRRVLTIMLASEY
ncbi:MAG: DUF3768 domain-containing protein [Pseudomonadota bacterium]